MQHVPYQNGRSSRHSPPPDPLAILMDQSHALGRIEGTLDSHGKRLDRIETGTKPQSPIKDLMPYLYGLAVLVAAATGKTELVLKLLGGH